MRVTNRTIATPEALQKGLDNLLLTCLGLKQGDAVLLVKEPDRLGLYSLSICDKIASRAREIGAEVTIQTYELITEPGNFPPELTRAMEPVDHTIFMSRIGDYSRFSPFSGRSRKTQCYALDEQMFASHYASTCYQLMTQLHRKLEAEMTAARSWHVSCGLGTDLQGRFNWPSQMGNRDDDFSLQLFPTTTFKPIACTDAAGVVALSRWLMPGSIAKVQPFQVDFAGVVMAAVNGGVIEQFTGSPDSVETISRHYDAVAESPDANRNRVHSWHAGLNPHTFFDGCMRTELARWEGLAFASPRYLHIHTGGDRPPGEVTWSVFNPTVTLDGETYWKNGQCVWYQRADNLALIEAVAGGECLLEMSRGIQV